MRVIGLMAKGVLVGLLLSLLPVTSFSATKISTGAVCKVYKQKVTYHGKIFTCVKSGKKLIWNKGVPVKVSTPTPTPTQTPTPTASPSLSPTAKPPLKQKPTPSPARTSTIFPPENSVSAITKRPINMQGINVQHFLFSGGMDPAFVTLGPKTGSRPELGYYDGKSGVNFEIGDGEPILAPVDARFIGFNNRNSDFRNGMDGTLQVPFDDLELCFESMSSDWPGLIFCFYHLQNSPLLLGIDKDPLCSNAKEWPGPLRAEGWQFYTENDSAYAGNATSAACQALLGREVKRGAVIAYSGSVGTHSQAPIRMKVPDKSLNPTVKSGDRNLHWVQGDAFFYWKCFAPDATFEQGVLAYPWECNGFKVPTEQRLVDYKYEK